MGVPSLWPLITFLLRTAVTLFGLLLARLAYLYYLGSKPIHPRLKDFPEPSGKIPVLGHIHTVTNYLAIQKAAAECGPVMIWRNFHETWITINTPELCNAVMNHPNSIRDNWVNDMEGDIFGRAMFVSEGEAWSHPRSVLSTVVTREALGHLCPLIIKKADTLINKWFKNGALKEAKMLFDYDMVALTMDVIGEIVISEDIHVCDGDPAKFRWHYGNMGAEWMKRIMFYNFLPIIHKLPLVGNVKCWYSKRCADDIVKKAYNKRYAMIQQDPKLRFSMLDAMIHEGFTQEECMRELTGMIFAGHDTTAHTISFATYELSRNPEVLAKLRKEAQEVIGNVPADKIGLSHVNQLRYAADVIRETLRFYPIAGAVLRTFTEDTTVNDVFFPKGYQVSCLIIAVHFDPKVYPEPYKWNPERWSEGKIPPASWIPFAAGPHVCLGQNIAMLEAKLAIAYFSLKVKFEAMPNYQMKPYQSPTLMPQDRLPMRATLVGV